MSRYSDSMVTVLPAAVTAGHGLSIGGSGGSGEPAADTVGRYGMGDPAADTLGRYGMGDPAADTVGR